MEGNHSIDFCFFQKGTKDFFLDHSLSDKESFLPRLFISVVADPQQDIHRDHDGIDDIEDECEIICQFFTNFALTPYLTAPDTYQTFRKVINSSNVFPHSL